MSIELKQAAQDAAEAIDWLLKNIRLDAPQLSGKAMGNAEKCASALRTALAQKPDNTACRSVQKRLEAQQPVTGEPPIEAIGRVMNWAMEQAVANGANSVSMPDEIVEIAAWLAGIPPQPAQATQAEVTDAAIDAATRHIYHNGRPTSKEYRVGIARAILALRPERVPMTGEQWTDVLGSAGPDMLDLAKQWADNKIHVYQVVNQAEKIVKAAVLRGITAQIKKETP